MVNQRLVVLKRIVLLVSAITPVFLLADIDQMIKEIEETTKELASYTQVSEIGEKVVNALRSVDRAKFVSKEFNKDAFENTPLPIGHGQTISQPLIVALMTEVLDIQKSDNVLEVGTGSGYQAAVLGKLAHKVFTIEIVSDLAKEATARLKRLGYDNVEVRDGDGWYGWSEVAPFDKIMVTATAEDIPTKLVEQLKPGGMLVMPIGDWKGAQTLTLLTKSEDGESYTTKPLLPVRFVPMTGEGVLTLDDEETDSDQQ